MASFKELSKIHSKTKDIIKGWIRNKEQILKLRNVPDMVKALCILYYAELEKIDKDLFCKSLKIVDNYKSVKKPYLFNNTYQYPVYGSAFGSNVAIKGKIYHWRLRIGDSNTRFWLMNIGIIEADKAKENLEEMNTWWYTNYGYSYFNGGRILHGEIGKFSKKYNTYKSGDIIDVWLDLKDKNTLSYARNDEYYGVAFMIPDDKEYRLALSLNTGEITIDEFQVFYA